MENQEDFIPISEAAKKLKLSYEACFNRAKRRNLLLFKEVTIVKKKTLGVIKKEDLKILQKTRQKSDLEFKEENKLLKEKLEYVEKKLKKIEKGK